MMGYWWCAPQDRDVCARKGRLGIEINVQGPEEVEDNVFDSSILLLKICQEVVAV